MNIRGWLALGAAVAAIVAAALAGTAAAGAATSAPGSSATSGAASEAPGTILGIVPARGARPMAATPRAVAACTEPNCNMPYHGGPVQTRPRVYVDFWGPKWKNSGTPQTVMHLLTGMYTGLGQARDTWSLTASQYDGRIGSHATFGTSVFGGAVIDANKPQRSVTVADIAAEARKIANHFGITNIGSKENAQIVIAAQSGTCFAPVPNGQGNPPLVFVGSCGRAPSSPPAGGYCGYHTAVGTPSNYLTFTNLPFQLDGGGFCGEGFLGGTLDGFTIVGGHEFGESVTDPIGNGWIDYLDGSGGEVADKCAWGGPDGTDPAGDITLSTGSFPMQSLWSNVRHGCVMTGKLPFHVTALGNQSSGFHKSVSIQVTARTTPRVPLTWHASGLPRSLSITHAGLIHGTTTARGTFHVRISVSYYAGSASFGFTWRVS